MKGGGEGLDGRPRPGPLAPCLEERDHLLTAGDHEGPPHATPLPSPLRNIHLYFVRLMPIRADKSAVGAINRPLREGWLLYLVYRAQ